MSDAQDLRELQHQALRLGFTLRQIGLATREVVTDVVEGRETATEIAEHRGIARTAASNRLKAALVLGLLEDGPPRGRKKVFSPTFDGRLLIQPDLAEQDGHVCFNIPELRDDVRDVLGLARLVLIFGRVSRARSEACEAFRAGRSAGEDIYLVI